MRTRALWLFPAVGILLASTVLHAAPIHQWSQRFGDATYQSSSSVATDGSGNVIAAGSFIGTVDFGGGPLTSASNSHPDMFVVKLDAAGNHVWSRKFGGDAFGFGDVVVAGDGSGNVIIAGSFNGTLDLGGDPLTSAGNGDIFIAKFNVAGTHLWSESMGDSEVQTVASVVTDGSDNIVIAGRWGGGRPLIETYACVYFRKFDPSGNQLWESGLGCGDDARGNAVVDGSGNVIVTGSMETLGVSQCRVAKFDTDGNNLWSHDYGDYYNQAWATVATDASGNAILTGYFFGTVDFGGGPLTSAGGTDLFVVKFDASGAHLWSQRFGDEEFQNSGPIAADDLGHIVLTGGLYGTLDFGGGPLTSAGANDVFVAVFDGDGDHLWSRRFGDVADQYGTSVDAYGAGSIVLTGGLSGTADFGGGSLTSAGSEDVFIAKFSEEPLPVLITSFDATPRKGAVEVTWEVWSDEALESFALYRRDDSHRQAIAIAQGLFDPAARSYVDTSVEPEKTYHYELLIHTQGGNDIRSTVATVTTPRLETALGQNFPNPFWPSTTIEYTLSERSNAVVGIYDAAGRLVVQLDQGVREAGVYRAEWSGRDAGGRLTGSGVYFYRLEGAPNVAPRKMVRLK